MRRLAQLLVLAIAPILPALTLHGRAETQTESSLGVAQRVFSDVGAGFRAIRRGSNGRYYVLTAPGSSVQILDDGGSKIGQVPPQATGAAAIVFGVALDVDANGRVYVADYGGNAVNVYAADGSLLAHIHIPGPTEVAALPGDEFAVASMSGEHLIAAYDFHGVLIREFADPVALVADAALNRRLNGGRLISDTDGNLYYAFTYLPEPTVRKYDRFGYLTDEITLKVPELEATTVAVRRDLIRVRNGGNLTPREVISAMGVDPATQEIWLALGSLLVHANRNGEEPHSQPVWRAGGGAGSVPDFLLVEHDRLLVGTDPQGIFALSRSSSGAAAR